MAKKRIDLMEIYFPTDPADRLEYVLQRAKKVLSEKTRVVTVHEIRPGPEPMNINEFPSVEVVVRILGIPFEHPFTHQQIIPLAWFRNFFESVAVQKTFVERFCNHVAARAPDLDRLNPIKRRLRDVSNGRPSMLPPRLDLLFVYQELLEQVTLAKKWLEQWRHNHDMLLASAREEFLKTFSAMRFRWLDLIENGQLDLAQIVSGSAEDTSKLILAVKHGVKTDAIHSRLFRRA